MAFSAFTEQADVVQLLQRSLERGRLGHAYLFNGPDLGELERMARTLTKTLNCQQPTQRSAQGLALDCCDACLNCQKIDGRNHPDVIWVRPESKLRVITVEQVRNLLKAVYLKPTQATFKTAIIVGADRLKTEAANAFLKTLEEPPADSILILLSTDPQRILETILSRCLRLNFAGEGQPHDAAYLEWLGQFAGQAAAAQAGLLGRYTLLSVLLQKLNGLKHALEERLRRESPLATYPDAESELQDKWEKELAAAIESEYRRQRADVLKGLQGWLRDVWLATQQLDHDRLFYPQLAESTRATAQRLDPGAAMQNLQHLEQLQRLLHSNVQEALALEVALLKLNL